MKAIIIFFSSVLLFSCATHKTAEGWSEEETIISSADTLVFENNANPRIHDIWVLESIPNKVLKIKQGAPRLEIYVSEKRFSGFDGCNEIFGDIILLDSTSISIGDIGSTLLACTPMKIPNAFHEALRKTRNYSIAKM